VRKTDNSWIFCKSKGHNFIKKKWTDTNLELDLELGMQCNVTNIKWISESKTKCRKLIYRTDGRSANIMPPAAPYDFVVRGLKISPLWKLPSLDIKAEQGFWLAYNDVCKNVKLAGKTCPKSFKIHLLSS
jgi:hypothetical protein